MAVIYKVT